jgi:uncharacterized membrane protein YqaE (UPF0057 family)
MRLLLALLMPCLPFLMSGRALTGVICLVLQFTLIGWLPAALWAVYSLEELKLRDKSLLPLRQPAG